MNSKSDGFVILVFAVILVFITPWGYTHIPALCVLLPLVIAKIRRSMLDSVDLSLILLFGIAYALVMIINQGLEPGVGTLLRYAFVPTVFFLAGSVVTSRLRSSHQLMKISVLLLFFFSVVVLASITLDLLQNGLIAESRNLRIIGEGDELKNATGINAFLAVWLPMLGLVFYRTTNASERNLKALLIFFSSVSMLYSLRLGSRTGISTAIFGIASLFLFNFNRYRVGGKLRSVFILVGLSAVASYFLNVEDLFVAYQDRIDSDDNGAASAGGRTESWEYYFVRVLDYPMGGIPPPHGTFIYAHNYFLDVARVSGLLPTIIIVLFTFVSIWRVVRCLRSNVSSLVKNFIIGINVGFYLVFMVEPVVEGCFNLFCLYLFYCGLTKEIFRNARLSGVVEYGS